jgi:hypothetical protein
VRERLALIRLQREVAPHTQRRDEEPAVDTGATFDGTQTAAEREEVRGAVRLAPAEFDPGVAETVGVFVEEEIPLDAFRGVAVGLNAMWRSLAIEQER